MSQNQKLVIKNQPVSQLDSYEDIAVISFSGDENGPFEIQGILDFISEHQISIDMLMRQEYIENRWSFSFSCSHDSLEIFKENDFFTPYIAKGMEVNIMDDLFCISIIGAGMATTSGVVNRAFRALDQEGINFYHVTTSEISTTVTIDKENRMKAIIALSTEFEL